MKYISAIKYSSFSSIYGHSSAFYLNSSTCKTPVSRSIAGINAVGSMSDDQNYNLAQSDDEIFDIYPAPPSQALYNSIITSDWGDEYSPSPQTTGETKTRRLIHSEGDWHRSVQVWVVQKVSDGKVRVLLQRRSKYKDTHPNMLDVSCAGHIDSGEDGTKSALRELQEELGGNGNMDYTLDDLERSKAFVVTSSIKGETAKYGAFTCNEYQDVFILWWKDVNVAIDTTMFAPMNQEEVAGFEVVDGSELIQRMRNGDASLVPRSPQYIDALAKAFCLE
jgi:isopentenyldiphosphate isomerase